MESDFDPEEFVAFISKERNQGENVDSWSQDELETVVALFKRISKNKDAETQMFFQLEDIELEDNEDYIYAKRVKTNLKKETLFTNKSPYVMIESI